MLTSAVFCAQIDLSRNALCGLDEYGRGTYTAEGITAIADAMGVSHSLTSLLIGSINFGDEGCIALAEAMQQNDSCKIEELSLIDNGIGVAGSKSLAAMIAVSHSLSKVFRHRFEHASALISSS